MTILALLVSGCCLVACSSQPSYQAQVELQVDGKQYDYRTTKAQIDDEAGKQGYSVYLLPEDEDGKAPYVALRTYSGNPVARLWVRYTKPERVAQGIDDLDKYQCYVPSVLSDGRQTLGWKKVDGKDRHPSETGEAKCQGSVAREGNELHFTFDAEVRRKKVKAKKGKAKAKDGEPAEASRDTVVIRGKAVITLSK